jgi:hypothetical protein
MEDAFAHSSEHDELKAMVAAGQAGGGKPGQPAGVRR